MAITSFPFDNQDTTETQFSYLFRELQDSGVADGFGGTSFQPFGDSTGMTVKLRAGFAIVRGFAVQSDAVFTVTLPAADSTPRVDRIVLRLDPTANSITPTYIKGVAGAGVPPALTQTDTAVYDLPVATVNVAASAPNIGPTDVVDVRPFVGSRVGAWTTATRPAAPRKYQMGFNDGLGGMPEWYDGASWSRKLGAFWGSGTVYPTVGVQAGDTYYRTDFLCLMSYDGTAWRQVDHSNGTATQRAAITAPYGGFEWYDTDTGATARWDSGSAKWLVWDSRPQSFTPAWQAATIAPGTGGYNAGWYFRMGKRINVHTDFAFGGAGATFGSGAYRPKLPTVDGAVALPIQGSYVANQSGYGPGGAGFTNQYVGTGIVFSGGAAAQTFVLTVLADPALACFRPFILGNATSGFVTELGSGAPTPNGSFAGFGMEGTYTYIADKPGP